MVISSLGASISSSLKICLGFPTLKTERRPFLSSYYPTRQKNGLLSVSRVGKLKHILRLHASYGAKITRNQNPLVCFA